MDTNDKSLAVVPSLGKRFIAYLIDFILAFAIGALLNSFVTNPFLYKSLGGKEARDKAFAFANDSGLVKASKNDDGTISNVFLYGYGADGRENSSSSLEKTPNGEMAYEAYLDMTWNYYTSFLPSDSRSVQLVNADGKPYSQDDYYDYAYKIFSLPNRAEVNFEVPASRSGTSPYFQYAANAEGTACDFTKKPILKQSIVDALSDGKTRASKLEELKTFFLKVEAKGISSQVSGVYYDAVLFMQGQKGSIQKYFASNYSKSNMVSWVCSLVASLPVNFIVFFLIPVIDRQGRSISKFILGQSVVSKDDILLNPFQRIGRPFLLFMLINLLLIPNSNYNLIIFAVVALIDFGCLAFSKKGESLHDKICKTHVVMTKDSLFFANYLEKDEYLEEHRLESIKQEAENQRLAREDTILDLSTINLRREEAKRIVSFDEFEKEKDLEAEKKASSGGAVNLSKVEDEESSGEDIRA